MTLEVLLFGPQAVLAGRRSVSIRLSESSVDCRLLRRKLIEAVPELAESLPSSRFAVNHELVGDDQSIRESDEIALIGMVSGG